MHEVTAKITLRASWVAAFAIPTVAFLAGISSGVVGKGQDLLQTIITGIAFFSIVALAFVWLMVDARERAFDLALWHFLGLLLAPVAFVPFYFNQTRERKERLKANILFFCTGPSLLILFWLGSAICIKQR